MEEGKEQENEISGTAIVGRGLSNL